MNSLIIHVGIALGHRSGTVSQNIPYGQQVDVCLNKPGRTGMAQIMEGEVCYSRSLTCGLECSTTTLDPVALPSALGMHKHPG